MLLKCDHVRIYSNKRRWMREYVQSMFKLVNYDEWIIFVAVCFTMTTIYIHDSMRQTGKRFEIVFEFFNYIFNCFGCFWLNMLVIVWLHLWFFEFNFEVKFQVLFYILNFVFFYVKIWVVWFSFRPTTFAVCQTIWCLKWNMYVQVCPWV